MANESVLNLENANFENEVIKSEVPVLVDFWAPWCAPCRALAPTVDEIATEYDGRAKVGKVNIDDNQAIAQKYNVMSIPTILVFKGGEPVGQVVGAVPKSQLQTLIDNAL